MSLLWNFTLNHQFVAKRKNRFHHLAFEQNNHDQRQRSLRSFPNCALLGKKMNIACNRAKTYNSRYCHVVTYRSTNSRSIA